VRAVPPDVMLVLGDIGEMREKAEGANNLLRIPVIVIGHSGRR